ncbi:MAG: histidinol dehydrogenase, partial [Nannocystaceae bacterium]|nr:histidinol dehydrogenase [Nannocystaceae bacterium]
MEPFEGLPRIDLRRDTRSEAAHAAWRNRCQRSAGLDGDADAAAATVIAAVAARGDAALVEFIAQFEGRTVTAETLEVTSERRDAALATVPAEVVDALSQAADNIRRFHLTQCTETTGLVQDGIRLHTRLDPLRRVAVYAPGGTAAYPSSVLMTAIPAKVAGVTEVILLTPRATGPVLVAAHLSGADRIFEVGGAQAIAAAALGTATIPRVDKIVGPGNAYVTAAKRRVYGLCDIDGIAGPSEILVAADSSAQPEVIAADMLAQAEHDRLACAIVVTDDSTLPDRIDAALATQLADLPRRDIALPSLQQQGAAVLVDDRAALLDVIQEYCPEHLELLVQDARALAEQVRGAGAIFVGPWTPEAAGGLHRG